MRVQKRATVSTSTPDLRERAREAATLYADDASFADVFDQTLAEIYTVHAERLKRISIRLGQSAAPEMTSPKSPAAESVLFDRVLAALEHAPQQGFTRGEIALRVGIESGTPKLAGVLRTLRESGTIIQQGERRSARYRRAAARTKRRG